MNAATETTPTLTDIAAAILAEIQVQDNAVRKAHGLKVRKCNPQIWLSITEDMSGLFSVHGTINGRRCKREISFGTECYADSRNEALVKALAAVVTTVVQDNLHTA